jgi:maltooligosyltrehalose trehalohydrolase
MLLLFLPSVPLLFMGQEWAASSPFCYFTDHEPELGMTITQGRRQEFAHFTKFGADGEIPDPQAESTFMRSKLDWSEREREPHASSLRLYRLLLSLRRTDTVLRGGRSGNLSTSARAQVLCVERWQDDDRRWLFVNFGPDTTEIGLRLADKRLLVASSTNALVGNALLGHAAILVASSQPG